MRTMDEPTQGPPSSPEAVFLSGLKRLARPDTGGSSPFHRTRSPFIRQPLTERYYRRADGLTLCGACFERRQEDGRAREATEGGSPLIEGP